MSRSVRILGLLAVFASIAVFGPAAGSSATPKVVGHVYWATWSSTNSIGQAYRDGTSPDGSFITGGNTTSGVIADANHIYWTNWGSGTVGRANLNGTGVDQNFITGGSSPAGVAIGGNHIYWANYGSGTIGRANLNGTGVDENFITGAIGPIDVEVDANFIYWPNQNGGTIGRANLDGSNVDQSFIGGAATPSALALDGVHVFWANWGTNTVGRADLDGTDVDESFIVSTDSGTDALAVDSRYVYWGNYYSGTIGRAALDGTNPNQGFMTGLSSPAALWVTGPFTPATPTITNVPVSAHYGEAGFVASVSASGDGTTSITSSTSDVCTVSGFAVTYLAAGTCTLTAHVAETTDYAAADGSEQSFSIAKVPLTITALDRQKIFHFGLDLGTTAYTVSGLVGSDSVSSVTLTSAGSGPGAAPGSYALVPSAAVPGGGTNLDNYAIHYVDGTLGVLNAGIVGLSKVSIVPLEGRVDSYDSSLGPYDHAANSSGDAFALSNGTVSIGHVAFGGDVLSTQGNVRLTTPWAIVTGTVTAGTTVANPGHVGLAVTANHPTPAIVAPPTVKCSPFSTNAGISGPARSFTYFPGTGDLLVVRGTVTLARGSYCFHKVTVGADARLRVTGPVTVNLTGKWYSPTARIFNTTHLPSNLLINSSYAGTTGVSIGGGPHTYMTIVAPTTGVSIVKGPFYGRILADTVKVTGKDTRIHQDVH